MNAWKAKRVWKAATAEPCDGGYTVRLDGRGVRTPAKNPLVVPNMKIADRIAAEWAAQEGEVRPLTMPFTRSANAAIDKVAPQRHEVAEILAAYGDSDLICYRAEAPGELVDRQNRAWDPLLDWSAEVLNAPLQKHVGVTHVPQPAASLAGLARHVHAQPPFRLTALHDLVALSGSLVIGLAVALNRLDSGPAWAASRLDEAWQIENWGEDDEAARFAAEKELAFRHAAEFFRLAG